MISGGTLAVITARGGSKGLPGKNIRPLGGRPLIEFTLLAAAGSARITETIVSTDSDEIARVARQAGGVVPFMRPAELAQDETGHLPVIQHALRAMEELRGRHYDMVVTLQPTSPFRLPEDIDGTIDALRETGADGAVAVCEVAPSAHPVKAKRLEGGLLHPFCLPEPEGLRRQDLPPAYRRTGAVYVSRRETLLQQNRFYGDRIAAYLMPARRSVDIDTPLDWAVAELVLQDLRQDGFPF
ncbi:MAG TPA: acylneuraminate cytidylyltransferase family protein [Gemmatimonadales bacterium]|jgi:CMP-N-acetylneuraminic acid synthetase|nr:acylneuraminate cytidylyltransferase family protein [Gemmatimonadales bacterium]